MFTKRTKPSRHVSNPESLESGPVINKVELASQPALQLLDTRKKTVERGAATLETSFAAQFIREHTAKNSLGALHVMRSVARPEIQPVEDPVTAAQQQPQPETPRPTETSSREPRSKDNTVVYMDEYRTRRLLREDANRQVEEALDSVGKVEAELVTTPEIHADQFIPDLTVTEDTPLVVTARENVQLAIDEAERMKAAIKQAELDAELGLLANQRSQERAAA